ncbi:MAG: thioredoxin family protein [Gemmatimonadota bacterium]|nr:MAG: thioredoxin family protein [Gemmatimonadota bacterium]
MKTRSRLASWTACLALGLATVATAQDKKMSTMAAEGPEIGKPAPDFTLTDTDGNVHRLADYTKAGKIVVLEWFNPDCPFVKKHHKMNKTMATTYSNFAEKDVVWLAVNSGAKGNQGYGHERNVKAREEYGIQYPVLLDEDGVVGRLYQAKTTPQMFVIGAKGNLLYQGAIDDNRSADKLGEKNYVQNALDGVFAGHEIQDTSTKSYGCSVKYAKKAENSQT